MSDRAEGDDLPIIDVRSPAERFADSGRDGFALNLLTAPRVADDLDDEMAELG